MGLLLSVLVFSVGVVEALSCYNRIRSGYLPLNHQKGRQHSQTISDITSELDTLSAASPGCQNVITDEEDDSRTLCLTQSDVSILSKDSEHCLDSYSVGNFANEDSDCDDDNESGTSEDTVIPSDSNESEISYDLTSMQCSDSNYADLSVIEELGKNNIILHGYKEHEKLKNLSQDSWFDSNILSSLDPNILLAKKNIADKSSSDRSAQQNISKTLEDSINFAENVHIQRNQSKLHRSISEPGLEDRIITGRLQLYANSKSVDEGLNERRILAKEDKQNLKKKVRFNLDTVQICFEKDSVSDEHNSSTTGIIVKSRLPLMFRKDESDKVISETLGSNINEPSTDLSGIEIEQAVNSKVNVNFKDNLIIDTDTVCITEARDAENSNEDIVLNEVSAIATETQGFESKKFVIKPKEDKLLAKKILSIEENDNLTHESSFINTNQKGDNLNSGSCGSFLNEEPEVGGGETQETSCVQEVKNDHNGANGIIANMKNENIQEINVNKHLSTNILAKEDFHVESLRDTNKKFDINPNKPSCNERNEQITHSGINIINEGTTCPDKQDASLNIQKENTIEELPSLKIEANNNLHCSLVESSAKEADDTKEVHFSLSENSSGNHDTTSVIDECNEKSMNAKRELTEDVNVKEYSVSVSNEIHREPTLDSLGKDNPLDRQHTQTETSGEIEFVNQDDPTQTPKVKKSSKLSESRVKDIEEESPMVIKNEARKVPTRRGAVKSKLKIDRSVEEENPTKIRSQRSGKSRNTKFQEASGTESEEDWNVEEVSDGIETESDSEAGQAEPSSGQDRRGQNLADDKSTSQKAFWLIFSGEYTKAMSKDWHSSHFCCWQCDESLTGQRYVLRDDHPYCIKCYESVFANSCEECSRVIGIDSKDLSYKDKHWHEACFLCSKCRVSLVDKQFGSKADKIYCGNCYDAQFASRCDGCGQIFRAGTKKMEYKTRQWHEQCFCCCMCKTPIGTKSFIPREQEIYCATCYEEKFATRCVKCNKIITSGGVTYKNEPWHRECFTCTNCGTSLAGQRFTSREDKPYCADCFGELFAKRCTACCKPITGIGGTRFISFEDRHWHNDCFICASCKTSLVGRGFITDGEDIICPECAKQKLM